MSFFDSSDAIYGSGQYGAASYGVASGIVQLSSVSATAQLTAVNPVITKTITGVSATGQIGAATFANDTTELLSSASATATLGTVTTALNTYVVTVVNDGGNKYRMRDVTAPTLTFNRGNTYTFDLSDSSNSGHPLAFKDALGNSFTSGVTTVGIAGTSGAKVTIEVDGRTFSSLRYYCTVHGNAMGNTITVNYDATYVALYGTGQFGKARYGIAQGVANPVGVQATGSIAPVQVNGLEIDLSENLDSVSATGSIGSVQVNITEKVTGVQGVGQNNSIVLNATQDLTGVSATGAINTVGIGNSARPTGVQATGIVNILVEDITDTLTGVQGTTAIGSPTIVAVVTVFVAANYSRQRTLKIIPNETAAQRRKAA
jgi:hypothetical protein